MNQHVEHLIGLLQQVEELYARMLPVIEKEKEAAVDSDPAALLQTHSEKQNLVAQLQILDRQRTGLLRQIAQELHLPMDRLTLSDLADHVPPPYSIQLKSIHASLGQIFTRVRRANEESRMLVRHCLDLVRHTLGFLSRWSGPHPIYSASGSMSADGNGARLVSGSA